MRIQKCQPQINHIYIWSPYCACSSYSMIHLQFYFLWQMSVPLPFFVVNGVCWSANSSPLPSVITNRTLRIHIKGEVFPVHVIKIYGGKEIYLHSFLTLTLDAGEWSTSLPDCCILGESALGAHWVGFWVGPRACLGHFGEEKMCFPCHELNDHSSVSSHNKTLKTCFHLPCEIDAFLIQSL